MSGDWDLALLGLPWWAVVPASIALAWVAVRLLREQTAQQPPMVGRALRGLRAAAIAIAVLLLLEPALTRRSERVHLPQVAVVVDASASMAVDDRQMAARQRLDEAVALGLLDPALRPDAGSRAARAVEDLAADMPTIAAALTARRDGVAAAAAAPERCAAHAARSREAAQRAGGVAGLGERLRDRADALDLVAAALRGGDAAAVERAQAALDAVAEGERALAERARRAQDDLDRALVAGAEAGSPVAAALARLSGMSRLARSAAAVRARVEPRLRGVAELRVVGMDERLPAIDPASVPSAAGTTDLAAPLAALARDGEEKHLGAVLVVSDGRQTAGADPLPVARALAARAVPVSTVCVGDAGPVRDAVLAALDAPAEAAAGESVQLEARLRIVDDGGAWDLVVTRDGEEIARRTLRGDGGWHVERFDAAAGKAGVRRFTARLERARGLLSAPRAGGTLEREVWHGVPGELLQDALAAGVLGRAADDRARLDRAAFEDQRLNHVSRVRGWLLPPQTGAYTFWVSGDDETRLRVAADGTADHAVEIAAVPGWTDGGQWDRFESQRSAPVPLEAGRPVFVELLHKQGLGMGHAAIGWQLPDNTIERPIGGQRIARSGDGATPSGAEAPEASLANNVAEAEVVVDQDPLRVLLVDATPRWESRYLASMFERERRVELVRRYRSIRLSRREGGLLPSDRRELERFDVVVLGDLGTGPGELTPQEQARLAAFVGERGGFLVCIAGERGMPRAFSLGALADLLPVRIVAGGDAAPMAHALQLADGGERHPATAVLDDSALNQRLWPSLPEVQWLATGVAAKAGAQVLLRSAGGDRTPAVVAGRHGAGRVLYVGTPETWRWRDRLGDRVHQSFWLQAVRWGVGMRLRGADQRLHVALDHGLLEPGEAVELRARARGPDGAPSATAPTARLTSIDEDGRPTGAAARQVEMTRQGGGDLWSARVAGLPAGRWRLEVASADPALAGVVEARELSVAQRSGAEGVDLAADAAALARLARAGGGVAGGLADIDAVVDALAERLKPRREVRMHTLTLWSGYGALGLVTGLLAVEWLWRRRRGLP